MNNNKYYISTYSAKSIIEKYRVEKVDDTDCYDIRYVIDFRKPIDLKFFLKSTDLSDDTAMYYQFRKIMNIPDGDVTPEDIRQEIIILDFHDGEKTSLFDRLDPATEEMLNREYKEDKLLKPWSSAINNDFRLRKLFDNGIDIIYEDRTVHYVPFDKSNSMARDNKITFVNEEHLEELTRRLNLDIDFANIDVTLSKYYAYRGLYLTTADRFDIYRAELKRLFNEETVIVVPDAVITKSDKLITAERVKAGSNQWKSVEISARDEKFKAFDGEGIISPELTQEINQACGYDGVSSFQVRMPFMKGMLHEVDFKRFIKEEILEDPNADTYEIVDEFGVVRNLFNAHIIIPVSMFKCNDWLKKMMLLLHEGKGEEEVYPLCMRYYFEKFHEYNHCMYISNTDVYYGVNSHTNLNYQFFNTLAILPEEVKQLVKQDNGQYHYIQNPLKYIDINNSSKGRESDEGYDDDVEAETEEDSLDWKDALKNNPILSHEKMINEQLISQSERLRKDIAMGRIIVDGEIRYLSRDLLSFLLNVIDLNDDEELDSYVISQNINKLTAKVLGEKQFYMPDNKIELDETKNYALFRNPHLSRNEQCVAIPYIESETNDIYNKYFSQLSGVLMVGYASLVPQALGGADFDGDIVKVISDEIVVRAVVRGVLDKKKKKELKRQLPIVQIPDAAAGKTGIKRTVPDKVSYEVIKNTFSNNIGRISNVSVRLGDIEYNPKPNPKSKAPEYSCIDCTILTGLEIDAAKTGEHPELKEILDVTNSGGNRFENLGGDYILFKERISEIYNINHRVIADEYGNCYKKKSDIGTDAKPLYVHGSNPSLRGLNTLPACFFESLDLDLNLEGEKTGNRYIYFDFLSDPKWLSTVDSDLLNDAAAIIKVYYDLNRLVVKGNRVVKRFQNRNFVGHVFTLFEMQYGPDEAERIRCNELDNLYDYVADCFEDLFEVRAAITRLRESRWAFVKPEKRVEVLKSILNRELVDYDTIKADRVIELLSNPNAQGYNILYFMLLDIERDMIENMPDEDLYEKLVAPQGSAKGKKAKIAYNEDLYNSTHDTLYKKLLVLRDEKKSDAMVIIYEMCVNRLKSLFAGLDDYDVLKLLWALSSFDIKHKFLWRMVPVKCMNEHAPAVDSSDADPESNPEEVG